MIPFPANSAEFEEFLAVTGEIAREIFESTPDPEPEPDDAPDDSHLDGDWTQYDDEPEDRYLDTYWEDQSEYGMEGCCGDF